MDKVKEPTWVQLIEEARQLGLTPDDIRSFFDEISRKRTAVNPLTIIANRFPTEFLVKYCDITSEEATKLSHAQTRELISCELTKLPKETVLESIKSNGGKLR